MKPVEITVRIPFCISDGCAICGSADNRPHGHSDDRAV